MTRRSDVLIVGGGVLGVACAHELHARGRSVTLLERSRLCAGASHGNAGWLAVSHAAPLPQPGLAWQALKWMFRRDAPFRIHPRCSLDLLVWLWRFWRRCNSRDAARGLAALAALHREAVALTRERVEREGLACEFRARGQLGVFLSEQALDRRRAEAAELSAHGFPCEVLDAKAAREAEPALLDAVRGAIRFRAEADLVPTPFVAQWAKKLEARGVRLIEGVEVEGFDTHSGSISAVVAQGRRYEAGEIVLAAGAHTPALARRLGLKLWMQAGKGYSVTLAAPKRSPATTLMLAEARVAVTPWARELRLAGTLELDGLRLDPDPLRMQAVLDAPARYLKDYRPEPVLERWSGAAPAQLRRPADPGALLQAAQPVAGYGPRAPRRDRSAALGPAAGTTYLRRSPLHGRQAVRSGALRRLNRRRIRRGGAPAYSPPLTSSNPARANQASAFEVFQKPCTSMWAKGMFWNLIAPALASSRFTVKSCQPSASGGLKFTLKRWKTGVWTERRMPFSPCW
ncbi:MAG: FAD-dependent oxidoreductase [Planctomycetota bacterium]|nr:FAD-dependent oxidoreductase [Planctomycetota bacterium]